MQHLLPKRSDEEWIAALQGRDEASLAAVAELQDYLRRALAKALGSRAGLAPDEVDELAQEAALRLVEYLHTFRGDSAFTTWATAVAMRVAFTELRRRRVRDRGRQSLDELVREAPDRAADEEMERHDLLDALQRAIDSKLTERQRAAVAAELRGLPTIEIAEQLGTNQNALYKLVHDARKKLRSALEAEGYTREVVHEYVQGAQAR